MADSLLSEPPRKLQIFPQRALYYWDLGKLFPVPKTNTLRKEEIFFFLMSPQTDALIALTYSDLLETIFDTKIWTHSSLKASFLLTFIDFSTVSVGVLVLFTALRWLKKSSFIFTSVVYSQWYNMGFYFMYSCMWVTFLILVGTKTSLRIGNLHVCLSHSFPHNYILIIIL